jgi:hypothetical protein
MPPAPVAAAIFAERLKAVLSDLGDASLGAARCAATILSGS